MNPDIHTRALRVLALVDYKPDWTFCVASQPTPYLQVTFPADGEMQKGRKWLLSEHMVDAEIVQTAFLAIKIAEEHELRETFSYKGVAIFGPHLDLDMLSEVSVIERIPLTQTAQ